MYNRDSTQQNFDTKLKRTYITRDSAEYISIIDAQ